MEEREVVGIGAMVGEGLIFGRGGVGIGWMGGDGFGGAEERR